MKAAEKSTLLLVAVHKLKHAANFGESILHDPVKPETMTSLHQLTTLALEAVEKLRAGMKDH